MKLELSVRKISNNKTISYSLQISGIDWLNKFKYEQSLKILKPTYK